MPLADASGEEDFARHESPAARGFGLILCRASGSPSGRSCGATGKCAAVPCGVAQGAHRAARGLHLFGPGRGDSVCTAARPRVGHRACRRDWAGALHRGASDRLVDAFETPLGRLPVDHDSLAAITDLSFVVSADGPHAPEHALEVELPFLQTLLKPFAVVPHRKMWLTFFAGSGAGRKR